MNISHPTPYPELNTLLLEFLTSVQTILGDTFTAAYLQGSFALGDFDRDSDVDWVVVIEENLSDAQLAALQALHARIYDLDSPWAQHLEGSYIPKDALRRPGATSAQFLFLGNTSRELVRSSHDNTVVVRWVVREWGITLAGPEPYHLVDPIAPDELRQEVAAKMGDWAQQIFANPEQMDNRWDQPYAVLSFCRMLHTLHTGTVTSKPAAARWAQGALASQWAGLIQRAWDDRPNPSWKARQKADPNDFQSTLEFIRYALTTRSQYGNNRP